MIDEQLKAAWERVEKARRAYIDSRWTGYAVIKATGELIYTSELRDKFEKEYDEFKALKQKNERLKNDTDHV